MRSEKKCKARKPNDPAQESPYSLDEQVGYLLRLANQQHAAIFQELLPVDFTRTQFAALVRLAQVGECSQNELGRQTAMDVATIKGVVDRLRKKGYVDVIPDQTDRRRFLISITDKSKVLIESLCQAGHEISDKTLEPLSPVERGEFLRLLRKVARY